MAYNLIITEYAEELIDKLIYYLLFRIKNEQAASHLLNGLEHIYSRLEDSPLQFPICHDTNLACKGYREALIPKMNYTVVFHISGKSVIIMGVFHQLENYPSKLNDTYLK